MTRYRGTILLVLASLAIAPAAYAGPIQPQAIAFSPPTVYASQFAGYSTLSADFDGDGDIDIVTGGESHVDLYRNDGTGAFAPLRIVSPFPLYGLVAGDLDEDGDLDLVGRAPYGGEISVLRNTGTGKFVSRKAYQVDGGLSLADLNGDDHLDLLVAGRGGLVPFAGTGTGALRRGPAITSRALTAAVVADFDGDGDPDIAATQEGAVGPNGRLRVFVGDGAGGFAVGGSYPVAPFPFGVVAVDLDRDGVPDLAVATGDPRGTVPGGAVSVLRGTGSAAFTPGSRSTTPDALFDIAAADFDLDGAPDIAAGGLDSSGISVFAGDGAGGLALVQKLPAVGAAPSAGDYDADGDPDLTAVEVFGDLLVWSNMSTALAAQG